MPTGKIILLNGSSSSGKTTLSHALQKAFREPYQHIALDQFRDGMPGRYRGLNSPPGTPGAQGLNIVPVDHADSRVTEIRFGDMGKTMLKAMRRAIRTFALEGQNVIIDDILFETDFLKDYLLVLKNIEVIFVGVRCGLDTVNEREGKRSGRFPGTATSHFEIVHQNLQYDLEVDTRASSPDSCASQIVEFIQDNKPTAFKLLRSRYEIE
jgi:chloramphenicol 3-O phosphotransferase